jgi:hypothetical protein
VFRPRRILTLVGGAAVVAALGAGVVAGVVPADVPARVASYVQPPGMLHGTGIVLSRDALVTYPPLLERLTGSPRLAAVGPSPRAAPRQATAMGVPCRMVVAAEKAYRFGASRLRRTNGRIPPWRWYSTSVAESSRASARKSRCNSRVDPRVLSPAATSSQAEGLVTTASARPP